MKNISLTPEEKRRYSRHILIPEVGVEGQQRLKSARVLIIGAGGLGSPLSMYLAAAGVGTIGIVEFDTVETSNLQRQLLYGESNIGDSKLESATRRLHDLNPHIKIVPHACRLSSENAMPIIKDYDIVVDGTDNFPTRYLVNDACVLLNKPNVYGSIFRFEGQVSIFDAKNGPCYRCLYPEPPPPGVVPSCAEGGVLGVLPGIIGSLQALETIKLILDQGDSLCGRLVLFDALSMRFSELKIRRDPACPVCGDTPSVTSLIDYDDFCGLGADTSAVSSDASADITAESLHQRLSSGESLFILDVRRPEEYEIRNLNGYLIPLHELPGRLHELDRDREIVVHCLSGGRSAQAKKILLDQGFSKVRNLLGGISAWADRINPGIKKY